jgi:hypothetical protein
MSASPFGLSAAEDERARNVRAFTFERFNRVGMTPAQLAERARPLDHDVVPIQIGRLRALADAVREQLLRQIEEADLHRTAELPHPHSVPISQDERRRDLLLIRSQALGEVPPELAAIAYLEAEGDVVDAIRSLDSVSQRARFETGLRRRQAQLGLLVTQEAGELAMTEERREVLGEARRAFQRAVATRREVEARAANLFVDGGPIPSRVVGSGKSTRVSRLVKAFERQTIRSEMEALEEQVEACTIDENTYNEKAMELKNRFQALDPQAQPIPVASHFDVVSEVSRWLRENASAPHETTPPVWHNPPSVREPPEEVDWALRAGL